MRIAVSEYPKSGGERASNGGCARFITDSTDSAYLLSTLQMHLQPGIARKNFAVGGSHALNG